VQMGSTYCATQAGLARGSQPTWPFGPRPKSRGALAADTLLRRSGQWGAAARARGGGEGAVRGGRGVGRAHSGLSMVVRLGGEKPVTGVGTDGYR
jgi:hypothetical protein